MNSSKEPGLPLQLTALLIALTVAAILYLVIGVGAEDLDIGGRVSATVAALGFAYFAGSRLIEWIISRDSQAKLSDAWLKLDLAIINARGFDNDLEDRPYLEDLVRRDLLTSNDAAALNFWREQFQTGDWKASPQVADCLTEYLDWLAEKVALSYERPHPPPPPPH
jgi:hypothetical protein